MIKKNKKIIRVTTTPGSLLTLLNGQLRYMSDHYDVTTISSNANEEQLDLLKNREKIKPEFIEMTREITPLKDLIALFKLYKLIKKEKPHIVHSHTPKAGTLAMLASKIANVPHRLHTVAGLPLVETSGIKKKLLVLVDKITYVCANKIYPNSYGLKAIMLKENLAKESKLKVLENGSSNGIDTSHFNPILYNKDFKDSLKKELNIDEKDFIFIFIGRLVKDKGINELVKAFDDISKEFKKVKLLLVGGYEEELGPLLPETKKVIKENKNIITTGWLQDVRPYLAISDVLTFPSYREGFPNVVMQASSMELTCIVSDINGCNEIIKDNVTGFIIPKKDTDSLYKALIFVLSNQDRIIKMGVKSRENIINNYEQKVVWKAILNEYNQL